MHINIYIYIYIDISKIDLSWNRLVDKYIVGIVNEIQTELININNCVMTII